MPRSVAMAMVSHKTKAIYRRYAIRDEVTEGAAKRPFSTKRRRARPVVVPPKKPNLP